MRIGLIQMAPVWEDKDASLEIAGRLAASAKLSGVEWIVFPEMFATGFSTNTACTTEKHDGRTTSFLRQLATDLNVGVIGGLVLKGFGTRLFDAATKPFNAALVIAGDKEHVAHKIHLFGPMGEKECHASGCSCRTSFKFGDGRAAVTICYDLRFPETFRLRPHRIFVNFLIASWPAVRRGHLDLLARARAVENQCYFVVVNRVGSGGGFDYSGGTAVYGPDGEIVAAGKDNEECIVVADLDLDYIREVRRKMPFLDDMGLTVCG
jgi:predicted amidohydrolase